MSEGQLSALLAKLKEDAGFREKLQGAGDLEAALEIAQHAGFALTKADFLRYQATQILELSDEQLESATGGEIFSFVCTNYAVHMWRGACGGVFID